MFQYIIFSLLVIAGLVTTICQMSVDPKIHPIAYQVLSQISGTLLIGGTLSLLYKIFVDRQAEKRLLELFRVHESVDMCGLKTVLLDSKNYNFSGFLNDSDYVEVVMNDGHRWVGNYSVELENRFSRKGTTTFYIVDPAGKFVEALAQKVEITPDEQRAKISKTESALKGCFSRSKKLGKLEIYHLKNYPTQSIFASESLVIVTPYQTSSGRRAIPLFVYEDNKDERCHARDLKNDLRNVRTESELVYTSQ